jgi:hypothetical protein
MGRFQSRKTFSWSNLYKEGIEERSLPGSGRRGFLASCMIVGTHFVVTVPSNQAISVWAARFGGSRTKIAGVYRSHFHEQSSASVVTSDDAELPRAPSGIVHPASGLLISLKNSDRFIPAEILNHGDASAFQRCHPVPGFWSFVESDRNCVRPARATDDLPNAGPNNRAIAHGAWFTACHQLELRHPTGS